MAMDVEPMFEKMDRIEFQLRGVEPSSRSYHTSFNPLEDGKCIECEAVENWSA